MLQDAIKSIYGSYKKIPLSARASIFFLFANIFQKAVMVIFTPLFTRIMTAEEFSQYAVFQSWETILTVFATLNISNYATAKALVEYRDHQNEFVSSAEFLTALLAVFVFGIFILIRSFVPGVNVFPMWVTILLFVDLVAVAFFSFWSQTERFNQRYKTLTVVSVLMGMASPIIAFLLILFSQELGLYKGWARIIGLVLTNGVVAIFLFYYSFKKSSVFFSLKYWKYCFSYCIPLIPHFLSMAFLLKVGQLFVDHFCGGEKSGIYALANSLALLMMVFNDALTKTLVPWTYQKMACNAYKDINKPISLSLVIIAVLDVAMALVAPELVRIFADSSYFDAIYAIPPLVSVCFFGFLYNAFANIEYYYKETKLVSLASIFAGIAVIVANYVLVPRFGYLAAAYSAWFSYVIYAIMHYVFMQVTLKKHLKNETVYDGLFILKLSVIYSLVILIIPVLYTMHNLRWAVIGVFFLVMFLKRKSLVNFFRFFKKAKAK